MATTTLPPGFTVSRRDGWLEVQTQINGTPIVVQARPNGPPVEQVLYRLTDALIDKLDYRQMLAEHSEQVRLFAKDLDIALNGEANAAAQPALVDIVAQVKDEVKKKGKPLIDRPPK